MHNEPGTPEHIAPLPMMKGEGRAFRYALWPLMLTVALVILIMVVPFLIPVWVMEGFSVKPVAMALGAVWFLTSVALTLLLYKYRIDVDGIRGWDAWGFPMTVRWREVVEVKPISLLGLRFARLVCEGSLRALWFPLWLGRMSQAAAMIREYAPPCSPIYTFFEQYARQGANTGRQHG